MGVGRHTFLGGNFFMLRMLNRYRSELGVEALPQELEAAASATIAQLQQRHRIARRSHAPKATPVSSRSTSTVRNLTGHKLPTGYPSRRAWLHVTVRDRDGQVVFESGAIEPSGLIRGNDNDADAARFEPHYTEIRSDDQVQIYESVMRDVNGNVTTGLLRGTGYVKDNRLLPRGFDKATAVPDIAVRGAARAGSGLHRRSGPRALRRRTLPAGPVRSRSLPSSATSRSHSGGRRTCGPTTRMETRRFVTWYDEMASGSSQVLASATASIH